MRLSIVCDKWDEKGGGCEQYLAGLVSHAASLGIKTDVHASRINTSGNESSMLRVFETAGSSFSAQAVLAVRPFAGATHYQLHTGLYTACFQAERESLRSPTRRLLYPLAQCLNVKRQRLMRDQDQWLKSSERPELMVFSRLTALGLQDRYGIDPEKIHINPHGADLVRFSPSINGRLGKTERKRSQSGRKANFLFVGHNFLLKGLHCLFEAISRLRKKDIGVPLQVAGAGPVRRFERLAEKLGIRSQIHFLGYVSQDRLAQIYRKSVALIHPTFYDPCSLVVLEALACGCPVVTTRKNGAAELIHSGREGFILDDPRNIESLCDRLRTLRDPRCAEEMSRAALEQVPRLDIRRHMGETMRWLGLSSE